jgi:hypothetical protein
MHRKIDPLILTLCIAWVFILGGLGVSAIVLKHISIGTRLGVSTSDGISAVVWGIGLIGLALLGLVPLLDGNRFRRQLIGLLATAWFAGSCSVLWMFR